MTLLIDTSAARRAVGDDEFRQWASGQTVFLSSVMEELKEERAALAEALERDGFEVRWFEEFGGRDDSANEAYLSEVARATLYLGLMADAYGPIQASGFSATHEEFLEARRRGIRVSFWARTDDGGREGHARRFLAEVQVFNVTGRFSDTGRLVSGVRKRLREMAAEDIAPWVKLGDIVFRARTVEEAARELTLTAEVRDGAVLTALRELAPDDRWSSHTGIPVTTHDRTGKGQVEALTVRSQSTVVRELRIEIKVEWASGGDPMAASTGGLTPEDLAAVGLRVGMLGEEPPGALRGMEFMVDGSDPFDELQTLQVPEGALQPIARLLVVERLVGARQASAVRDFALGPSVQGRRRVHVQWDEARRYANVEPASRSIEGDRAWG